MINIPSLTIVALTILAAIVLSTNLYFQPYNRASMYRLQLYLQMILLSRYFNAFIMRFLEDKGNNVMILLNVLAVISPVLAEALS
jgi:hypothetical protein